MPKCKRRWRARSQKIVDAVCVRDAIPSAVLRRRWSEVKRHNLNFRRRRAAQSASSLHCQPANPGNSANPAYFPNNPFTDLTGFCVAELFTIPLAACFNILPTSA